MAISDTQQLNDLKERVEKLEQQVQSLLPKELHEDLYGQEVDHTEERAERASIAPRRPSK